MESLTRAMWLLVIFSGMGGFIFGYGTGVVSGAMLLIREEMNLTTEWHEIIVSVTIAAAWLSSLIAGPATNRFGRRVVILCGGLIFFVGCAITAFAQEKIALLLGRIVVGVAIGFVSMSVPVYLSESSTAEERGCITIINTLFVTGGQFVSNIVCGVFSHVPHGWRYMLGLGAVPCVIQLAGFTYMPESPRWLVANGRLPEARRVLSNIRSPGADLESELEIISAAVSDDKQQKASISQVFKSPSARRALFIGGLLQLFQQITGVNIVMCGVCNSKPACGFCFITGNTNEIYNSSCIQVDPYSHNKMSLEGDCSNATLLEENSVIFAHGWCPAKYSWIPVIGLAFYLLFFSPGMGVMPWTVNSEIFPGWARSTCNSLTTAVNWGSNLIVSLTFLTLTEAISKHGAFYLYMSLAGLGVIIFYFILPETRGIPLEEVEDLFSGPLLTRSPSSVKYKPTNRNHE